MIFHLGRNPETAGRLKFAKGHEYHAAFPRPPHHGLGQGMLAAGLSRGRQRQGIIRAVAAIDMHPVGKHRLPPGDGAGLVEHHDPQPMGGFQSRAVLEKDTQAGAQAGAHHDGGRCGQPQGARAGDDQDGHHVDHGHHKGMAG